MIRSVAIALTVVCATPAAEAQQKQTGTLVISPNFKRSAGTTKQDAAFNAKQESLLGRPVLVTVLHDGKVVKQRELQIEKWVDNVFCFDDMPAGRYDFRFEGEGFVSVVKAGMELAAGADVRVIADLEVGQGVRVTEYGRSGDPAADLAAHLERLRAELDRLRPRRLDK